MNFYVVVGLAAFLISLLGTRLTILARRKRFKPTIAMLRGKEASPVPDGGGIAVVFALAVALLIADVDYAIVLSLFILTAIALLDDLLRVSPLSKWVAQLAAVVIALAIVKTHVWPALFPMWFGKGAIILLWLIFIRSFDRMDGIDGLAATETICIAGGLSLLTAMTGEFSKNLFSYGLATATASAGFLWWNWHPAKIKLGKVGSLPIGFFCGYLLFLAAQNGYGYAALILPAYVLSDGVLAYLKRVPQGQYYLAAAKNGWRTDWVVRSIFGIHLLLILLAVLSALYPAIAGLILAVAYAAVFMLLGFFAHTKAKDAA